MGVVPLYPDMTNANLDYLPIYIEPANRIKFTRCQVLPGVTFERTASYMISLIDNTVTKLELDKKGVHTFHSNFGIRINVNQYHDFVLEGLKKEVKEKIIERIKNSFLGRPTIDHFDIAKQILISLLILRPFTMKMGGRFNLEKTGVKNFTSSSWSSMSSAEVWPWVSWAKSELDVTGLSFAKFVPLLSCYFNPYSWQVDRLAAALNSFWAGLTTNQYDQAFISLTTSLEALMSTGSSKITHRLAERTAFLLGKSETERGDIYKQVKEIYGIRSDIVHGKVRPKKGKINTNSLVIDAKHAIVPISKLCLLSELVQRAIQAVIREKPLLEIIQKEKDPDKKLNEYFT